MRSKKYLVGIDEVGRGPLAGPVAVGVVIVERHILRMFTSIKDSKALSAKKREEWYAVLRAKIEYKVAFVSHTVIDRIGIVASVRRAITRSLDKLKCDPNECEVRLDGGLKAPDYFVNQRTIIRGDEIETVIAMASVVAKVLRDRWMVRLSRKYPEYGFEKHKGYGTRAHCEAIEKYGLCEIHRKSFCRKFLTKN